VLFAGALALLLVSAWSAVHLDEVEGLRASVTAPDTAPTSTEREGYSLARVMEAVNNDPFHPLRRRPAHRLQPVGGQVVEAVAERGLSVQVIGTAVSANGGGFAMCAWGGAPPRIVRIGERVGDWTLRAVTPGAAQFTSSTGATVVVRIAKAGEGS
jgi:hypothetical protein